jgi:hypothetical protein
MEQTIKTYTTKSFENEGVAGSEPVKRLVENGNKGITTQVMEENNSPVEKVAHKHVKMAAVGNGVDGQPVMGKFKGKKD